MMTPYKILFRSFVQPFYKENAGAFLFFTILLFCIVGKVDGAELLEYHVSLATGILQHFSFLVIVLVVWLLYSRKCIVAVSKIIHQPSFRFLQVYNQLSRSKRFWLFFVVELWLLLPLLLYYLFLAYIGIQLYFYTSLAILGVYLLLSACVGALWHLRQLDALQSGAINQQGWFFLQGKLPVSYPAILLLFVARQQLLVWAGIRLFTCGILYAIARNNTMADYDAGLAYVFYIFGVLANGVLIYRMSAFEERYLSFYRGLAVALTKRFLQYCCLFAVLCVPEALTLFLLCPVHLTITDATGFMLSGYGVLLLMNSLRFADNFTMKEYLKVLFLIFLVSVLSFATIGLLLFGALLMLLAFVLFLSRYYMFEGKYIP